METDISVPRLGSSPCLIAPGSILAINSQPEFHHEETIRQMQVQGYFSKQPAWSPTKCQCYKRPKKRCNTILDEKRLKSCDKQRQWVALGGVLKQTVLSRALYK